MLKLSTIGTSWITASFIEAALATRCWQLEYVYSRDIEKALTIFKKYRPEGGFAVNDFNDIIKGKPDAVYIASPNSLHFEQSLFFIREGINVICEKPAAVNLDEWYILEDAARNKGVFFIEAFRHINSPGFEALSNAVSQIGNVRNAIFSYNQYSSRYDNYLRGDVTNIFNPEFAGGAMNDLGVYPISLAAALWGVPDSVCYRAYYLDNGIDGAGSMILDYKEFLCNITYSKIAEGIIDNEIIGEGGGVCFDRPPELSKIYLRPKTMNEKMRDKIAEFGTNTAEIIDLSAPMAVNKMEHEALSFADIIQQKSGYTERYEKLLKISRDTQIIMDTAKNNSFKNQGDIK
jgi:predicted dehydrogenase